MTMLQDDEPDAFRRQFSLYIKHGSHPSALSSLYNNVLERLNHRNNINSHFNTKLKYSVFCSQNKDNKHIKINRYKKKLCENSLIRRSDNRQIAYMRKLESVK